MRGKDAHLVYKLAICFPHSKREFALSKVRTSMPLKLSYDQSLGLVPKQRGPVAMV